MDATSDKLLRELLAIRALNPRFIESLLVLTFLPMLHGAVRRVARQQPALSTEDITQQALSFLLQYLASNELLARQTHFAFAISRAVKHKIFEWAQRETKGNGIVPHSDAALLKIWRTRIRLNDIFCCVTFSIAASRSASLPISN